MAGIYTIGSKLGYDLANGLGIGQSVTATDGSVWTKNQDGSITVNHQGQQMLGQITYNPMTQQQTPGQQLLQQNAAGMTGAAGYTSPYAQQLEQVIAGLGDSKWEGWDANSDPSMQAYRKQYLREAERSAEDVLGQYAQNTGGIAGSAAIAAATQASDYYKSQLADKVPELYENAYSRYLNEVAQKQNLASLMMSADDQAHSQYYQRINYALNKWAQMGYADQEVASVLGVAAGTPTSDQSYTDWNTAFQTQQWDYQLQQDQLAAAQKAARQAGSPGKAPEEDATGSGSAQQEENYQRILVSSAWLRADNLRRLQLINQYLSSGQISSEHADKLMDSVENGG